MRFDSKQVGLVKTTPISGEKVALRWSSDGGRALNMQVITLSRYAAAGQNCVCLNCPRCGRPRKRLFLVPGRRRGCDGDAYRFRCTECSGLEEQRARHFESRRKRRRGGPGDLRTEMPAALPRIGAKSTASSARGDQ